MTLKVFVQQVGLKNKSELYFMAFLFQAGL